MKKAIDFLKLKTLHIFLLTTVPLGIKYYDSTAPDATLFFTLLNLFGYFMYLFWFYSVCKVGSKNLGDIEINELKLFKMFILLHLGIELYFRFFETELYVFNNGNLNVTLPKPVEFYLFGLALILFIKFLTAKLIVTIEKNRKVEFKDFIKTFVLLLIPYIGILFVHYRVREKIAKHK